MELLPSFSKKITSNHMGFYYFKNVFDDQKIKVLEDMVYANYSFSKGRTGVAELGNDTDSYETNNRDIAYIRPASHSKWLYDLLGPLAEEANQQMFHFDLRYVTDPIHYVIYPEDGGHLDWHMDIGSHSVNKRKLAVVVTLSNRDEYTGGEFELLLGGEEAIRPELNRGDVIIFPTYLLHRVKPIINGTRKVIVFWVGGRPFR